MLLTTLYVGKGEHLDMPISALSVTSFVLSCFVHLCLEMVPCACLQCNALTSRAISLLFLQSQGCNRH